MCVYMRMYPFGCMHAESPICVCVRTHVGASFCVSAYGSTHLGVCMQKDTSEYVHMENQRLMSAISSIVLNIFLIILHYFYIYLCVFTQVHMYMLKHICAGKN